MWTYLIFKFIFISFECFDENTVLNQQLKCRISKQFRRLYLLFLRKAMKKTKKTVRKSSPKWCNIIGLESEKGVTHGDVSNGDSNWSHKIVRFQCICVFLSRLRRFGVREIPIRWVFFFFALHLAHHVTIEMLRLTPTHIHTHRHAIHSKMFFGLPLHWQTALKLRNNESISWFANITFMPMLLLISKCVMNEHTDTYTHAWAQIGKQRERERKKNIFSFNRNRDKKRNEKRHRAHANFAHTLWKRTLFVYRSHRC